MLINSYLCVNPVIIMHLYGLRRDNLVILNLAFTRMICLFEICFDLFEGEPSGFELHLRVKFSLIEIVFGFRIGVLPELEN